MWNPANWTLNRRYYWNKRSEEGLNKAIDYFQLAIKQDPNYALAYAGLADCYSIIGSAIVGTVPTAEVAPKARAAALKSLELDNTLAEAHTLRTPNLHRAKNRSTKSADGRMATGRLGSNSRNSQEEGRRKTDLTHTGLLMEGLDREMRYLDTLGHDRIAIVR